VAVMSAAFIFKAGSMNTAIKKGRKSLLVFLIDVFKRCAIRIMPY